MNVYGPEVIPEEISIKNVISTLAEVRPSTWSMYYRSIKGSPYSFDVRGRIEQLGPVTPEMKREDVNARTQLLLRHRPFLLQPLNDPHPKKIYKKGRQVGVSELSITEALWFLVMHPRTKVVYCFPREKQLIDFSSTRISEVMDESPYMRRLFQMPNQTFLKRIGGNSFLMLRSTWEANLGEGIDADVVIFDEKDRMKPNIEVAFKESLSSSNYGLLREVSTPTLPGRGIDASYAHSDQREWHVRCIKCGLWQTVEYPDNLIQIADVPPGTKEIPKGSYAYQCRKERCRGALNRLEGFWVPKFPSNQHIRGYMIPQTIAPWISADDVMQKRIDYKHLQLWENYVLAKTSVGESVLLTEADFDKANAGHEMISFRSLVSSDWEHVSIGVDWGNSNWCIVLGRNIHNKRMYVLNIRMFPDDPRDEMTMLKAMYDFIEPFNPDIIVADAGYGKDRCAYLLRRFPGKLFSTWYNMSAARSKTFAPMWNEVQSKLLVDRTMTLRLTCRAIREREIGFPRYDRMVEILVRHFQALAPLKVEEDGEITEVIESTGEDHCAHTLGYALLGIERLTQSVSKFSCEFV